jgi:hypothetical protein
MSVSIPSLHFITWCVFVIEEFDLIFNLSLTFHRGYFANFARSQW